MLALCSALAGLTAALFTSEQYESGEAHAHIMGIKMVSDRMVSVWLRTYESSPGAMGLRVGVWGDEQLSVARARIHQVRERLRCWNPWIYQRYISMQQYVETTGKGL